jgi:hypothetical protein
MSQKYAVLIEHPDGTTEVFGPFSNSRVERARETAETLEWVERASVVAINPPSVFRAESSRNQGGKVL